MVNWTTDIKKAKESEQQERNAEDDQPVRKTTSSPYSPSRNAALRSSLSPRLLLGMTGVARWEIGLLIVEIGYNNTFYVSSDGFITAIWAILLNTIIGPIFFGLRIKYEGDVIGKGPWGLVPVPNQEMKKEKQRGAGAEERLKAQVE